MMESFIALIPTGIQQGLILAIVALGVSIPYRLLNFPDLTAEGSYPLGGALCGSLMIMGFPASIAILIATVGGGIVGLATAIIHLRFKVNSLLAGIIVSTMVFSINLRLMGKPNIALFEQKTLFLETSTAIQIGIIASALIVLMSSTYLFLKSDRGLQFRAVGLNSMFAARQGINLNTNILAGLFVGNALCGLAGSLLVQVQSYADIGMGVGIIIHAIAAIMIGECLIGQQTIAQKILAPTIGAMIYQQIQGMALSVGVAPTDLKLLTGIIVISILALKGKQHDLH